MPCGAFENFSFIMIIFYLTFATQILFYPLKLKTIQVDEKLFHFFIISKKSPHDTLSRKNAGKNWSTFEKLITVTPLQFRKPLKRAIFLKNHFIVLTRANIY